MVAALLVLQCKKPTFCCRPSFNSLLLLLCTAEKTAANVPVSVLGEQYVKDTRDLTDAIETYITIVSPHLASKCIQHLAARCFHGCMRCAAALWVTAGSNLQSLLS